MEKAFRVFVRVVFGVIVLSNLVFADPGQDQKVSEKKSSSYFSKVDPKRVLEVSSCVLRALDSRAAFHAQNVNSLFLECCPECDTNDPSYSYQVAEFVNARYISECSMKARLGEPIHVKYTRYHMCEKLRNGDYRKHGGDSDYFLTREKDGVHLRFDLRFQIVPASTSNDRAAEMMMNARACLPLMREFWSQYGVTLDLVIDSNREKILRKPNYVIELSDEKLGERRSNSGKLYYWGLRNSNFGGCMRECIHEGNPWEVCHPKCENYRQAEFCLVIMHEAGHWLGLDDEYVEQSQCPNRERESEEMYPTSLMQNQFAGWDEIALFPRHMQTIFGPMCKKPRTFLGVEY